MWNHLHVMLRLGEAQLGCSDLYFCQVIWTCLVSVVDLQQLLAAGSRIIQQTCWLQDGAHCPGFPSQVQLAARLLVLLFVFRVSSSESLYFVSSGCVGPSWSGYSLSLRTVVCAKLQQHCLQCAPFSSYIWDVLYYPLNSWTVENVSVTYLWDHRRGTC